MRSTEYGLGRVRTKIKIYGRYLKLATAFRPPNISSLFIYQKFVWWKENLQQVLQRKRSVPKIYFDINIFLVEESLQQFRLGLSVLKKVTALLERSRQTKQRRYICETIKPGWIVPKRLSCPCRWIYLGFFGLPVQVLSEVFKGTLEGLSPKIKLLLSTYWEDLVLTRSAS